MPYPWPVGYGQCARPVGSVRRTQYWSNGQKWRLFQGSRKVGGQQNPIYIQNFSSLAATDTDAAADGEVRPSAVGEISSRRFHKSKLRQLPARTTTGQPSLGHDAMQLRSCVWCLALLSCCSSCSRAMLATLGLTFLLTLWYNSEAASEASKYRFSWLLS